MGKVFTVILFYLICTGLYAGSDSVRRIDFRPQHNFRLGFGALPENYFKVIAGENEGSEQAGVKDSKDVYTHSLYMNYMYAPARWLELGVYSGFASRRHSGMIFSDGSRLTSHTDFLITVMPAIRINWLRKSWVSMYTSFALGAYGHWNYQEKDGQTISTFQSKPTAQLLLMGISVGQNLYGFADFFGVGPFGLVSLGVGYKFPK